MLDPEILPEAGEKAAAANTIADKVAQAATITEQERNQDPEVLRDATDTENKVNTPEGDVAEVYLDFTPTDEEDGDNISGNKELRDDTNQEDETNSKRLKLLLHPLAAE